MRTNQKPEPPTPGFSIPLTGRTELGLGMLIAEDHLGGYIPVSTVSTIDEAHEIAQNDLRRRMRDLDRGKEPICPCAGSAGNGERALRVSVDAALRAGIFKASGSFDPMEFWDGRRE